MTLKEQMKYTRDTVLLIYKNNSGPDGIDLSPANLHRDEKSHGPVHLEDCAVLADSQSLWGCSATNFKEYQVTPPFSAKGSISSVLIFINILWSHIRCK